jgi:DNA polymerase I
LGAGDLSQIELRWLAILSGDEKLLEAYYNDEDLHAKTACGLFHCNVPTFEQRQRGKTCNFAIANQISHLGLLDQYIVAGVDGASELMCQRDLDSWFNFYRGVQPWFESVYSEGRLHGYIRDSVSGRILYCPSLRSSIDRTRAEAERIATNWKIQTAAQSTLKMGMVKVWDCIEGTTTEPLLQVHDELILEMDEDTEIGEVVVECLESIGGDLNLPIPIQSAWHQGKNWQELK